MEQWHFDPTTELQPAQIERLQGYPGDTNVLVRGLRLLSAGALRCWLRLYNRLTIVGRENLPADRSFVMIANHASHLDTLCLLAALPFRQLHCAFPAAAKDYFCDGALRAFVARVVVNGLPFDRQVAPWQSLSVCAQLLTRPGNVLIFFPEGTRSTDGELGEFKPGVGLLVAGRDIPVVPCHLSGTHAALPKGAWIPRPHGIRLTIGTPRYYTDLPPTKESARHIGHELRAAVVSLGNGESKAFVAKKRNQQRVGVG